MKVLERIREPEKMDDPDIAEPRLLEALDSIALVNKLTRVKDYLWFPIFNLSGKLGRKPLRILDIATGSGDIPIALQRRADKLGLEMEFAGCDLSQRSIDYAKRKADKEKTTVRFFQINAVEDALPEGYDVIMSSQFMHHLDPPEIISVVGKMKNAASKLVLIYDLRRSYFNLGVVWLAARLVSSSDVVHFDGPASVHAAFTRAEWQEMAQKAGLGGCEIDCCYPCHLLLQWKHKHPESVQLS